MELGFSEIKVLLLYFPADHTFDIRRVEDTDFSEQHFQELCDNGKVKVTSEYNGNLCQGVVVQAAAEKADVIVYENHCVFLKGKNFSLERILSLPYIPRLNNGTKRARIPNQQVGAASLVLNICQL